MTIKLADFRMQEVTLAGFRAAKIGTIDVGRLADGVYEGSGTQGGFDYRVRATVQRGRIAKVDVLSNRTGAYAEAAALIADKLAGSTNSNVDAISCAAPAAQAK